MALQITPTRVLDTVVKGEEISYTLDCTSELGTKTIANIAYTIWDSTGADVTATFFGGVSSTDGVILFGLIASEVGEYQLKFIVTCTESLPDMVTPYEFFARLSVEVAEFND